MRNDLAEIFNQLLSAQPEPVLVTVNLAPAKEDDSEVESPTELEDVDSGDLFDSVG